MAQSKPKSPNSQIKIAAYTVYYLLDQIIKPCKHLTELLCHQNQISTAYSTSLPKYNYYQYFLLYSITYAHGHLQATHMYTPHIYTYYTYYIYTPFSMQLHVLSIIVYVSHRYILCSFY